MIARVSLMAVSSSPRHLVVPSQPRPAAARPVAASGRRGATLRAVPVRAAPRRAPPTASRSRSLDSRATSAARSIGHVPEDSEVVAAHERVADRSHERDRDDEDDEQGRGGGQAGIGPHQDRGARHEAAEQLEGKRRQTGVAKDAPAHAGVIDGDEAEVQHRQRHVRRHDEQRVGRVAVLEPDQARSASKAMPPIRPRNANIEDVRERLTEGHAIDDRLRDRRDHADRHGRGRPEQRHRDDLHHQTGRDPNASRRDRQDVREHHQGPKREHEADRLPVGRG